MDELERRRPVQRHYNQQEAFLIGLFAGLPAARVLDYGCGFGRHLRNLRRLEKLELYGCDISAKMLETARAYVGDAAFGDERLRLIAPRTRLPYPDGFFDVSYTSEVLIHVDTVDLQAVLAELWRVTSSLIVHMENRPVSPSRRENSAHDGSWLHDFPAVYRELGAPAVLALPDVVENQCVYLIAKPDSKLATTAVAVLEQRGLLSSNLALKQEREQSSALRLKLLELQSERDELKAALQQERTSEVARAASALAKLPGATLAISQLAKAVERSAELLRAAGLAPPQSFSPEPSPREPVKLLSFAGVACQASLPSPDRFIAEQPKLVAICHPEWRGIRAATYEQARHVLEISEVTSEAHCRRLVQFLADCGVEKLVINGFPRGADLLARTISRELEAVRIFFVHHGTPAQHQFGEHWVVSTILRLLEEGVVRKLGFVKDGLSEFFRSRGHRVEFVMNFCRLPHRPPRKLPDPEGRLHLGVFAPDFLHKNVETQVLAALMIPGSVVHVCGPIRASYLQRERERIVEHGILPRPQLLDLIGQMHAISYVSLVECYPMMVLESVMQGAICVTSHTSSIFDLRPDLAEALVATQHDNPYAIARKLSGAIDRREELVPKAQAYFDELNALAERRWAEFLDA
ncbi:MAG: methyltransferase domain-containing protein [Myxococcales bacterium]|nr:methyltransferase domain-containing protein [Myxococcales bacterium]